MRSRLATVTLLPILDSGGGGVGVPKERRGDTVQVEYSTLETHNIEMIGCASPWARNDLTPHPSVTVAVPMVPRGASMSCWAAPPVYFYHCLERG